MKKVSFSRVMLTKFFVLVFLICGYYSHNGLRSAGECVASNYKNIGNNLVDTILHPSLAVYNPTTDTMGDESELVFELAYEDKSIEFSEKQLASGATDTSAKFAYHKNLGDKVQIAKKIKSMGFDESIIMNYLFCGLSIKVDEFIKSIECEPIDAKIKFRGNQPYIEKELSGKKVDKLRLYKDLYDLFITRSKISTELPIVETSPKVFTAELENLTHKRGEFSTNINGVNQEGRKHNIAVALSKFEGLRVEPGQKVSFNKIVGDTLPENGFELAKIIVNGKFVDGYGGGVCQASTTLYNALLLSGIDILEVRGHSLKVGYVASSFDSMVSYGYSDLVFENNTGSPIYITTYSNGYECGAKVYGEHKNHLIKRRTETLERDSDTPENVNIKSRGYLEYYQDGDLIKTQRVRNDTYYFPKTE